MAIDIQRSPGWTHKFFIQPFTRQHNMYRQNGNPDPHESTSRHRNEIAYRDGRIWGDLDLPTLMRAIKNGVIIGGIVGTWLVPLVRTPAPMLTDKSIEEATYSGMSRALTDHDATIETEKPKVAPAKGTGKPKAKPTPTARPAPLINQLHELHAIEPWPSYTTVSFPTEEEL